jgi:hypothetical protein
MTSRQLQAEPTLVYLYGPPAVGKLTTAERLEERTAVPVFHNHLTVNALRTVFEFGSPAFTEVIHRVRLDVFTTAARTGTSLIFTNNSMWGGPDGERNFLAFAHAVEDGVERAGGRVVFVRLTAPLDVLTSRVDTASRRSHHKLLDPMRLEALMSASAEPVVPATALTLDMSELTADGAAHAIEGVLLDRSPGGRDAGCSRA